MTKATRGGPAGPPPRAAARIFLAILAGALPLVAGAAAAAGRPEAVEPPLPLGAADLGSREIVFSSSGDLWRVDRAGGEARLLTTGPAWDDSPLLSPGDSLVAFTRDEGTGSDLYVLPLTGGEPRRLTWHPKDDIPRDWSADGRRLLFTSSREGDGLWRLYTIGLDDPWERPLSLPRGFQASWSPDGRRLASTDDGRFAGWLRYKGGAAPRIHLIDLATAVSRQIPAGDYGDWQPLWVGDEIYFLSERDGTANLFVSDSRGRKIRQLTRFLKYGVERAGAGPGGIILVRHGGLWLFSFETGKTGPVPVTLPRREFEHLRPASANVADDLTDVTLAADGEHMIATARGDLFLVDPRTGRSRNLTRSPGVHDRTPSISPDGRRLAWFNDLSGEYLLNVASIEGLVRGRAGPAEALEPLKTIAVGADPSFYSEPVWSPDGLHILTSDKHQRLWLVDVETGRSEQLDHSSRAGEDDFQPVFSPDGRRIAWSRHLDSSVAAVFVRDTAGGAAVRVSPDLEHCETPLFSADGSTLYMTRSVLAPAAEGFGMSSFLFRRLVTRQVVALDPDSREPERSLPRPLDLETGNYLRLFRGREGSIVAEVEVSPSEPLAGRTSRKLVRIDPNTGQAATLAEAVSSSFLPDGGNRLLVRTGRGYFLASADSAGALESIRLDSLQAVVDRRAEWTQIYHEAWRILRDYFYDTGYHGQDIAALEAEYGKWLPGLVHRRDLNDLMLEMLGHISVSHLDAYGGDDAGSGRRGPRVGLPGADFEPVGSHVRISRVLRGDNFSSLTTSPLAQPDVVARAGEWLLAVNGQRVDASRNVYSYFEVSSPAPVDLTLGPDSSGTGSRTVKVRLLPGENTLRRLDWAEANRRLVDSLSAGRLGYIYLPDTGIRGFQNFMGGFLAQLDRQGLIIDERFNSGGAPADLLVEMLARKGLSAYTFRDGADTPFPMAVFEGPKVMLINEASGSGGDTLPWMFRRAGLGPLIGTRTRGAGIGGFVSIPAFMDGGRLDIPNRGFYNPDGVWDIENGGVSPDIEIPIAPADWREGRDPQLERAIREALSAIEHHKDRADRTRPPSIHPEMP